MRSASPGRRATGDHGVAGDGEDFDLLPRRLVDMTETVRRRAAENPGRSLALAAGAGYLVGGGLFSPLTARIVAAGVRIGLRVALLPFVTTHLLSLVEELLSRTPDAKEVGSSVDSAAANSKIGSHARSSGGNAGRQSNNKETHS